MSNKTLWAGALLATTAAWLPLAVSASSHREAPAISGMPRVDGTDFYMFRSYEEGRDSYVTLIANYIPVQAPYGGPNYFKLDDSALYNINIDNNGDARADITFTFDFNSMLGGAQNRGIELPIGDKSVAIPLRLAGPIDAPADGTINDFERYTVSMTRGNARAAPLRNAQNGTMFVKPIDNIGTKSIPDYASYADAHIHTLRIPGCDAPGKVFVGQRKEAFAVNLGAIFDLVNLVPLEGAMEQSSENDDLANANVTSLALEVPISCITTASEPIIGAWTTATIGGRQVSRLSNPLVNEVVIGLRDKDTFNASAPQRDANFATYVTNPTLPALVDILFRDALDAPANIAPTNLPRTDLVTAFLTGFPGLNQPARVRAAEMLRLNTAIAPTPQAEQSAFGVVGEDLAGFPNGRRPGDDTVDIALRVMMGALCHPVPLGAELGVEGAVENTESDLINFGLCNPADAIVGNAPFTDFAPVTALSMDAAFPYLKDPLPGAGLAQEMIVEKVVNNVDF